jgi:hypothetical protein
MTETYIPTTEYNIAVKAFAAALGIDIAELKIAVGEAFDIWPEKNRPDDSAGKPSRMHG